MLLTNSLHELFSGMVSNIQKVIASYIATQITDHFYSVTNLPQCQLKCVRVRFILVGLIQFYKESHVLLKIHSCGNSKRSCFQTKMSENNSFWSYHNSSFLTVRVFNFFYLVLVSIYVAIMYSYEQLFYGIRISYNSSSSNN